MISFDQIAPVMRDAIVSIEDDRFYSHGAVDVKGIVRAWSPTPAAAAPRAPRR